MFLFVVFSISAVWAGQLGNPFTGLAGLDVDLGMNFKASIQGTFVSSTSLTVGVSFVGGPLP